MNIPDEIGCCIDIYNLYLNNNSQLTPSKIAICDCARDNCIDYHTRNNDALFTYLEDRARVDMPSPKIITNILFQDFIKAYSMEDEITSKTFNKYLSEFDFSNEYHKCNFNKIKGDIFEYIGKYSLLYKNIEAYLFNEVPPDIRSKLGIGTKDKGVDIVYRNDEYWSGMQCKWRAITNRCIDKNMIAGFIEEVHRTELRYGTVFTNVEYKTKYFANSGLEWVTSLELEKIITPKFIKFIRNEELPVPKPIPPVTKLRPYQLEAVEALIKCTKPNKQCIQFCGTGKTVVAIEYMKRMNFDKILVLVPSLQLINQFYRSIQINYPGRKILCICSELDASMLDADIIYTTGEKIIKKYMNEPNLITLSTYHSSHLLMQYEFDLAVFDEAHKTTNNEVFGVLLTKDKSETNKSEDDKLVTKKSKIKECRIKVRVHCTATRKYYKDDTCISMNNENIYGPVVFNYSYKRAREEGYILDFNIVVYAVPPDMESIIMERFVKIDKLNIEAKIIISAIQLAHHIIRVPRCTKILTYHSTVAGATDYKKTLVYIFNIFGISASIFVMSGRDSLTARNQMIGEFEKANIGIICSSQVLAEGIDIPIVNTIVFVDGRKSTINITQCIGRGLRLYENQTVCDIIMAIHYDHIHKNHEFAPIISALTTLSDMDGSMIESFISKTSNKIEIREMESVDSITTEIKQKDRVLFKLEDVIKGLTTAIMSSRVLSFEYKFVLSLQYCNEYQCAPPRATVYREMNIGEWLQDRKKTINSVDDEIYQRLSVNEYMKMNLDKYIATKEFNKNNPKPEWDESCALFLEYCDEEEKTPFQNCMYKGQPIGKWFANQKRYINDTEHDFFKKLSVNKYVRDNLNKLLKNRELQKHVRLDWEESYKLVCEYEDEEKSIPGGDCVYDGRRIGEWLNDQKRKVTSTDSEIYQLLSRNIRLKQHLDDFLQDKILKANGTSLAWERPYALLCKYYNETECTPPNNFDYEGYDIGKWFSKQKEFVKKKMTKCTSGWEKINISEIT